MGILSNAISGLFFQHLFFHSHLGFSRSMSLTAGNRLFSCDGYVVHIWLTVPVISFTPDFAYAGPFG